MGKSIRQLTVMPAGATAFRLWFEVAREITNGAWNGESERIDEATFVQRLQDKGAAISINLISELNPTGVAYDPGRTYVPYDYLDVAYQSGHYVYRPDAPPAAGNAPPNPAYWILISSDGTGSTIHYVTGTPANTLGADNDTAIGTDGRIYKKIAGAWVAQVDALTQAEGDARYPLKTDTDPYPAYLTPTEAAALYSPIGGDAQGGLRYNLALTTTFPAASGQVRLNNTAIASVTQLNIHESDRNGAAQADVLDVLGIGTRLQIAQEDNEEVYAWFRVSGAVVDNGSDRTVPVAFTGAAGTFAAGEVSLSFFQILGPSGGGASGIQYIYHATAGTGRVNISAPTTSPTLANATELVFNATDATSQSASDVLAALKAGAIFEIKKDPTNYARYTVTTAWNSTTGAVGVGSARVAGAIASGDTVYLSIVSDAPSVVVGGTGRVTLTANRIYYYRPDGTFTGPLSSETDATVNSPSTAFPSLISAINAYAALDQGGYTVTIKAGTSGIFDFGTGGIDVKKAVGGGALVLEGFDNNSLNTILKNTGTVNSLLKVVSLPGIVRLKNIRFDIDNFVNALFFYDSSVEIDNIYLKKVGTSDQAIQFDGACRVRALSGCTIEGSFAFPLNVGYNTTFNSYNVSNWNIVGSPTWGIAFILGRLGSIIDFSETGFTGSASGPRVNLDLGSHVRQKNASVLPGSTDGTITASCSLVSA